MFFTAERCLFAAHLSYWTQILHIQIHRNSYIFLAIFSDDTSIREGVYLILIVYTWN